jgi:hypothetical protein
MSLTQSKLKVGDLIFDARLCGPEAARSSCCCTAGRSSEILVPAGRAMSEHNGPNTHPDR